MTEMIKRIRLVGLLAGVEGFAPEKGMESILSSAFEYQGFDYFVRPTGRWGIWQVVKMGDDGRPLSEYSVRQTKQGFSCDCFSGARHLACRHKAMVKIVLNDSSIVE